MMDKEQKVALITGASRGIGYATAVEFAKQGYALALTHRHAVDEEVQSSLASYGVPVLWIAGDVSKWEDTESIVQQTLDTYGVIDVLVSNAGITKDGLAMRMAVEDFQKVVETNLYGAFYAMKLVSRHMAKRRTGRIISIASVVGLSGNAGQTNYAASKAGLIGLTKSLAVELAERGVTVNAVAPGFITSRMTASLPEQIQEAYLQQIPMKRYGKAEEVAKVIGFLASEDASYVTGLVISVDGGMHR